MTSEDYIFNTTYWISYDLAPSSRYCTMGVLEMYTWFLFKQTQFDSFGDVFAAWLQNLLGNAITLNTLYERIQEADEAGNKREIMYWYGRFATIFINFDPIVDDEISDEEFEEFEFRAILPRKLAATSVNQLSLPD